MAEARETPARARCIANEVRRVLLRPQDLDELPAARFRSTRRNVENFANKTREEDNTRSRRTLESGIQSDGTVHGL